MKIGKIEIDKKWLAILLLALIVIGGVSYYAYGKVTQKYYVKGVNDAAITIQNLIFQEIQQKGYVEMGYTQDGQNYVIRLGIVES